MYPERLSINYMDCTKPDNEGYIANNEELVKNAPKAYFSTLPKGGAAIFEVFRKIST